MGLKFYNDYFLNGAQHSQSFALTCISQVRQKGIIIKVNSFLVDYSF